MSQSRRETPTGLRVPLRFFLRRGGTLLVLRMRKIIFAVVLALASSAFAQVAPVAERVTKQNALFDEFYETGLKNSPERATSFGDYRYNSQLGQYHSPRSRASMPKPMIS